MIPYETTLRNSKNYTENIITDITGLLDKESIEFTCDASTIVIPNRSKKEISSLIRTLPIPKGVLYFALDICEVKNNVYVRKKIK